MAASVRCAETGAVIHEFETEIRWLLRKGELASSGTREFPGEFRRRTKERSNANGAHQRSRPARGPQRRRHGGKPGSRARCPGGGRQPRSGRPGRAVGRARRRDRRGDRRAGPGQRGRRPASPDRAREGRRRHPSQGRPARHPRHLGARRPGSPARRGPVRRGPRRGQHRRHRAVLSRASRRNGGRWPARSGPQRRHRRRRANRSRRYAGAGPGGRRRGRREHPGYRPGR